MKIALIEILRKYTFAQAPETVVLYIHVFDVSQPKLALYIYMLQAKLEQIHGFTSVPKNGVIVKITPRRK